MSKKKRFRYNRNSVREAYEATKKGMSVYKAAKQFGVPESMLRDRTRGFVSLDGVPGGGTLFTKTEEEKLSGHIKHMAAIGHGYNKKNIQEVAKEYALFLGKDIKDTKHSSNCWFYGFLKRWPEMAVAKPKKTNNSDPIQTQEELDRYYKELGALLSKSKD